MASTQDGSPPTRSRTEALLTPGHTLQHATPLPGALPSHGGEQTLPKFLPSRAALPTLQQTVVLLHPSHTVLGTCFSRMIWGMQLTELGVPWCSQEDTAAAQVITVHGQHGGSKGLGKEASSGGTTPEPTWQPMPRSWQKAPVKDTGTGSTCSPHSMRSRGPPGPLVPCPHRFGMLSTGDAGGGQHDTAAQRCSQPELAVSEGCAPA